MLIAIVDGKRQTPRKNLRGECPFCSREVLAKCGQKKIWHWAHVHLAGCDPWWENETDWHRKWKAHFPIECQEVEHRDPSTGERHVADIKTQHGMVIEFQNSPISPEELHSREQFYGHMIWIVNGNKFRENFHILQKLPDPKSSFSDDIVFYPPNQIRNITNYGLFWRKSENTDIQSLVEVHSTQTIEDQILENYVGHHQFIWNKNRSVWFSASKPVFLILTMEAYGGFSAMMIGVSCVSSVCRRLRSSQKMVESVLTHLSKSFLDQWSRMGKTHPTLADASRR